MREADREPVAQAVPGRPLYPLELALRSILRHGRRCFLGCAVQIWRSLK